MKPALSVAMVMALGCDGTFGLVHVDPPASNDGAVNDAVSGDGNPVTGLIAHYPMNGIAGGTLVDVAGAHDGACTACPADISAGKAGDALQFNGTSHVIVVPGSPAFATTDGMTIAVWLRLETAPAAGAYLCPVNLRRLGAPGDSWQLCAEENHVLRAWWYDGGDRSLGSADIGEDQWHHVALRWDSSELSLMIDGNVAGTTRASAILTFDGGEITIGADHDPGPSFFWDGSIDDLRIYNRVLTDSEIAALPGF